MYAQAGGQVKADTDGGLPQEESNSYISEIEQIGAGYEDMQGQNSRLLSQLANNDRVNNELVAERVKASPPPFSLCYCSCSHVHLAIHQRI